MPRPVWPMTFAAATLLAAAALAAADRPNVVVILADDLGYADVGANGQGSEIPTPNIDAIAAAGVRFTDGYAGHPVCAPTRAALMSGLYQHRFGFEFNPGPQRDAKDNFGLPRDVPTIAEKLKSAGYATGMVGKWHLGYKEGVRPWERGFDSFFGFLGGARTYIPDAPGADPLLREGGVVADEEEYLTSAFAREAVGFIERSKARPFFLYLAFNAVHGPLDPTGANADRVASIAEGKRRTYASMLTALDDGVGRVTARLRELGLEEKTLIVFYTDNGGPTPVTTSRNDPLRGFKGGTFEGGVRVPFLAQWKGTIPAGKVYREPVMGFDVHATALAAAGMPLTSGDRPLDGVDLVPFVTGKQAGPTHEQVVFRTGDRHAIRRGDWKLVVGEEAKPLLFNLKDDVGEQTDLAAKEPQKLAELQAAFTAWEKDKEAPRWGRPDRGRRRRAAAVADAATGPARKLPPAAGDE